MEEGLREEWFLDGTQASRGAFVKGVQDGVWTFWHENGAKKAESTFHSGTEMGIRSTWYASGQQESQSEVTDSLQHGERVFWHENGQIRAQAYFDRNAKVGPEQEFDAAGLWTKTTCYLGDEPGRVWTAAAGDAQPPWTMDVCGEAASAPAGG